MYDNAETATLTDVEQLMSVIPPFLLAVLLISASPGPAMALIFRRAALGGLRHAVPTVLGLEAGIYLWALAAGAGLAALVAASELAYLVLRIVGAAVLILLGLRAWRAAWVDRRAARSHTTAQQTSDAHTPAPTPEVPTRSTAGCFGEGLVVQLANPKAAVFMFSFYPQFIPAHQPVLGWTATLAAGQVLLETALYLGLAAGIARASGWFNRPTIRRRLDAVAGTVLIGLGLRVATTAR